MSILPVGVPRVALRDVAQLFLNDEQSEVLHFSLIIRIDDADINVRELGAYLSLMDRIYGRLTQEGLRSYAQSKNDQIVVREVRRGSIELIIEQAIVQSRDATPLIILFLFCKYFSVIAKASAEALKTGADAYKVYQDAADQKENRVLLSVRNRAEIAKIDADTDKALEEVRVSKENRRLLRQQMKHDDLLGKLDDNRRRQLAILLEDMIEKEGRQLPAAERFARKKVLSVDIAKERTESEDKAGSA